MNVQTEVIAYLEQQRPIPGATLGEKLACRYLDQGIIDSMGIVTMIADFEERFGIRFDADHMQSDAFASVGGLIGIIEGLRTPAS